MRKNRNLKKNYSANIYGLRSVFANRFGVYSSWHSRRNNASPFFFYSNRKSFAWYFIAPLKSQTFVWLFSTQLCNVTDQFLSFFLAQSVNVCYNSDNILGDLEYSLSNSSIILFFFSTFFLFFFYSSYSDWRLCPRSIEKDQSYAGPEQVPGGYFQTRFFDSLKASRCQFFSVPAMGLCRTWRKINIVP